MTMAPPRPASRSRRAGLAQDVEDALDVDAHDPREVIDRVVLERQDEALDAGVVEDEVRHAERVRRPRRSTAATLAGSVTSPGDDEDAPRRQPAAAQPRPRLLERLGRGRPGR